MLPGLVSSLWLAVLFYSPFTALFTQAFSTSCFLVMLLLPLPHLRMSTCRAVVFGCGCVFINRLVECGHNLSQMTFRDGSTSTHTIFHKVLATKCFKTLWFFDFLALMQRYLWTGWHPPTCTSHRLYFCENASRKHQWTESRGPATLNEMFLLNKYYLNSSQTSEMSRVNDPDSWQDVCI